MIDALRHDVPATGDWAVVAFDHNHRVCVAGRREITVSTLEPADMAQWDTALSHQIAAVTSETDAQ